MAATRFQEVTISSTFSAKLVKWRVCPGADVREGSVLGFYEKVGLPVEEASFIKQPKLKCSYNGRVKELLVTKGEIVPAKKVVAVIEEAAVCEHKTVMKDLCCDCGADLRRLQSDTNEPSSPTTASVPMIHNIPELRVTVDLAEALGKKDEERLLKTRKLALVVDLDQTLIHTTTQLVPNDMKDVYHFHLSGHPIWYHTKFRPGAFKFLHKISDLYELHIFTMGSRLYAHTIAAMLDPMQELFASRIRSRDECFNAFNKSHDLRSLFPCGDSMVCIIDDREDIWNSAPNLIRVKPYQFFKGVGDINAPPPTPGESNQLPPEPPPEELEDPPNEMASEVTGQVESVTEGNDDSRGPGKEDSSKPLVGDHQGNDTGNGQQAVKESRGKVFVESTKKNEARIETCKNLPSDQADKCENVCGKLLNGDESEEQNEEETEMLEEKKVSLCAKCVNDEKVNVSDNLMTDEVVMTDDKTVNTQNIEGQQSESAELKAEEQTVSSDKQPIKDGEQIVSLDKQPIKDGEKTDSLDKQPIKDSEQTDSLDKQPIKDSEQTVSLDKQPIKDSEQTVSLDKQSIEDSEQTVNLDKQPMKDGEQTVSLDKQPMKDGEQTVSLDKQPMKDGEQTVSLDKQPMKDGEQTVSLDKQPMKDGEQTVSLDKQPMKDGEQTVSLDKQPMKDGITGGEKDRSPAENTREFSLDVPKVETEFDDDDYLLHLEEILEQIHRTFYETVDKVRAKGGASSQDPDITKYCTPQTCRPDTKVVVTQLRGTVLRGTNIVFTGVIPTNVQPEKSQPWRLACALGANVSSVLVRPCDTSSTEEVTTHVIAARLGTEKAYHALKVPQIQLVNPNWLWCCGERWEWVDEELFPVEGIEKYLRTSFLKGTPRSTPRGTPQNLKAHCYKEVKEQIPGTVADDTASTRTSSSSADFLMSSINPLLSFSSEEIEDMDKEVEELMNSSGGSDVIGSISGSTSASSSRAASSSNSSSADSETELEERENKKRCKIERTLNDSFVPSKKRKRKESSSEKGSLELDDYTRKSTPSDDDDGDDDDDNMAAMLEEELSHY